MSLSDIKLIDNGAKFYRADLHIHSFGNYASYDVFDTDMTPEKIIDEAIKENISVISITDHNEIGNIPAALEYAVGKNILVVPGVELSTSQGHFLVYFETYEKIRSFIGELTISPDKKQCDTTITGALDIAKKYGGFGIAAHIDIDAGFENYTPGYTPFKEAILKHELLYGIEISNKSAVDWYTESDTNADRKRLFKARKEHLKEDNSYNIAKIMSSDAHKLILLGKNLSGTKKLTRIKMDELNFNSFRVAFLDANSRIRIEESIPTSFPKFIGIVSGNPTREDILDNEVWPDTIKLFYQDEAGQIIEFQKQKYIGNLNFTDPKNGIQQITIESFGQGETASTIQKCGKDPEILLKFIDNFIETNTYEVKDESFRTALLENQSLKERLKLEIDRIPALEQAFNNAKGQLTTLKTNNAKEVVELEEGIANERTLRAELISNLDTHILNITNGLNTELLKDSIQSITEAEIIVGKEEYKAVTALMDGYISAIGLQSTQVVVDSTAFKDSIKDEVEKWKTKEIDIIKTIEAKRTALEAQGIKLDISFIRKVTKDVSDYEAKLKELRIKETQFKELIKDRNKLLNDRKDNLDELYNERYKFIHTVNLNLKGSVIDYEVELRIVKQNLSPELAEIIKSVMGFRAKGDIIVEGVSYFDLIKAIYKSDKTVFTNLTNTTGQQIFSEDEALDIVGRLKNITTLGQIERVIVKDKPFIKIKKIVSNPDGSTTVLERDFSKLSMGQQQSILLTLLLYSKRNCPLIIDQPEDNLDSEFIYKTLVKNLKRIKEHRQVIIVTHNANIAVLGDSELILPLKSTNEKTLIVDRGSIDNSKTNKTACGILEGGETAFRKRQIIYNL
jgi:hypothetical protein